MGVIKFYKKTVEVQAAHWDGSPTRTAQIIEWAAVYGVEIFLDHKDGGFKLYIPTLEGPMYASVGDYIAKGIDNEFWAIKPYIMHKTYEEI